MFEKPIVFVDVDETLVRSLYAFQGRLTPTKNITVQDIDDGESKVSSMARPDAIEFLTALNELDYDVIICTSGSLEFQTLVLETHGIKNYKEIIGFREMEGTPKNIQVPWVLVDDCDGSTTCIQDKMRYLGVEGVQQIEFTYGDEKKQLIEKLINPSLIHVAYFGGNEDVQPLMSYIPEINEKIKAQLSAQ